MARRHATERFNERYDLACKRHTWIGPRDGKKLNARRDSSVLERYLTPSGILAHRPFGV
jgi:hypothetical protein